ncbi:leucyl/phenylalanyl-tRNA--protein transferase [Luteimonas sp. 3794]|uniref:leucyl/phenylalanyl-tRNA--protein transferase n=1 Tax=Luteimonas sp. 3794 TaxID=2817730 RepID=UPI00285C2F96|nr:leucyl/phenylalanyl-tRNA--protein transferase [Luteimonas sp. 3794]MDR6990900.1 leucyl/phenylalanyl-tRNA--protein transferase [Luteimonas sp. 3794]
MSLHLPRLGVAPDAPFPPVDSALRRPDGLLAFGGDLSVTRLRNAYRHGVFPWFSDGQPILWWSPDPRTVFETADLRPNRRFARTLRGSGWILRADTAFADVVTACAQAPRPGQDGTWITEAMRDAYLALHAAGFAHSVEVFDDTELVGGIYGVSIGRMFFGESMFSARSGASKAALFGLARQMRSWDMPLIDAQVGNPHLASLGAARWPRERFIESVDTLAEATVPVAGPWTSAFGEIPATALDARD